ncbi:methyltransferase domain-containing protein [Streptomyces sp. WMMB 322]|uniref:methyltransferase domain-containing protein n=1 Tax=Streptomyces sp. WMMB 322 TaxID=1286821 RepID=UPI0006E25412|nr:methyltransferase domain-containing protein [Streptomyces sp. WMMB 322]SCK35857.1 protein-L-isoaspartate(D-aspartate) O-methyltransferase [Streptomyces sp. WMMB 322]
MSGPEQLAAYLHDAGHLSDDWLETFRKVRREDFIPHRIWVRTEAGYQALTRGADHARWLRLVYSDTALVTQVEDDDGSNIALVPTSSSSMPRVVAGMLRGLRAEEGHRVLEAGTGTGFNAALLAHRLADHNVTTIEADPELADAARVSLTRAGRAPTVVTGDGAEGWAEGAPYDRVIVTYALHHVPYRLVQQTAPGGQLLLPWGTGLYNGVLARLTAGPAGDGTASGPVLGDCAFMWDRGQAPPQRDVMAAVSHRDDAVAGRTALDPRLVLGDDDAAFAAGVAVPGCRYTVGHGAAGEWTLWLADAGSGSWASLDFLPGAGSFDVQQHGPRMLWDEVAAAYTWWREAGSPPRTRFGLTVGPDGQHVWLDTPDNPVPGRE